MDGLANKSIIVTGGGSGIGEAAAVLLGRAGCDVTIADMNSEGGARVAAAINAEGIGRAQSLVTDVSNEDAVRAMVDAAMAAYGKLDGAINSAGLPPVGKKVYDLSLAEFERNYAVNLRGMFLCFKYQIQAMLKSGGGSIVAIASTAAQRGLQDSVEYCANKAGVTGLVRGAAVDCARQGIRINAVLPGGTLTPMSMAAVESIDSMPDASAMCPLARWAQPVEIANAAVWLISDLSSYVHGTAMAVDGAQLIV